jgi:hypothetical protein
MVASYTAGMPSTSRPAGCQPPAEPGPVNGARAAGAGSGGRGPVGRGPAAAEAEERDAAGGDPVPFPAGPVSPAVVQAASPLARQVSSAAAAARRALRGASRLIIPKPYSQRRLAHVTYPTSRL